MQSVKHRWSRSRERRASSDGVPTRLLALLCGVLLLDTMFYTVVPPLLPTLTREVGLSKAGAGVLTAAYAAGMLLGSIPCGAFVSRWGPRRALYLGLMLIAVTSVGFGVGSSAAVLDACRFVQGVGGAFTWAATLAWLTEIAPGDRRGEMIGYAIAAANAGGLLGPLLGTVAGALGRATVFSGVALAAAALGLGLHAGASHQRSDIDAQSGADPAKTTSPGTGHRLGHELPAALVRPIVWSGMWLMFLPGVAGAIVALLAPLRIARLGGGPTVIGVTFLAAAGFEMFISLCIGRISDRHGRMRPLQIGLVLGALLLPSLALPNTILPLLVLVVLAGGALGLFWTPALALFSETAESIGLGQGVLFALMNLGWAAGQLMGAGLGGAIAQGHGDLAALSVAGALCAVTALAYGLRTLLRGPSPAGHQAAKLPPST